jgi:hypothetical protein
MIHLCQCQVRANHSTECGNRYFPDYFTHSGGAYRSYYALDVVPDYLEASEHYYIAAALAQDATHQMVFAWYASPCLVQQNLN